MRKVEMKILMYLFKIMLTVALLAGMSDVVTNVMEDEASNAAASHNTVSGLTGHRMKKLRDTFSFPTAKEKGPQSLRSIMNRKLQSGGGNRIAISPVN